jgi:acyl carrier protein phosphodiesterase
MNYLAHLYLAGNDRGLLVGGFIADAVKGRQIETYEAEIIRGIRMHREIDQFTDTHHLIGTGKAALRSRFSKFSGIVMDVFGDHFLACNWERYSNHSLKDYSEAMYSLLHEEKHIMPERSRYTLHYMSMQDWLYNYQHLEGIKRALTGLARRSSFISGMETAHKELERNYIFYEELFGAFIPELIKFVDQGRGEINRNDFLIK